jgi:hypothetical protein
MKSVGSSVVSTSVLHKLLRAPSLSLAAWACAVARAVFEKVPVGAERAGYRHVASADLNGVVTHELLEVETDLVVCIVYRRPEGDTTSGFCQPWPDVLSRFVEAVLYGDLLGTADPFSSEQGW